MANILVVEDDLSITRLLRLALEIEEYNVISVLDGESTVQFALRETPHLIILDSGLASADSHEVTRRLREHPKSMHIPIIILSDQCEVALKVQAFESGADDYITRPFHKDELLARVGAQLRRVEQRFLSPLTGLPGGIQVEQAIKYSLNRPDPWSILYLDLDNFKAFNDVYGFLAGNDLIRLVGRICQRVVHEYGNTDDFVGHIGGDDFVIMTTPDCAKVLSLYIATHFKEESSAFYRPEDRGRGSISGVDRKGRSYQFPLVSLSIGEVCNQTCQPHSMQELSYLTAEAKYLAKQSTGKIYNPSSLRDRIHQEHPRSPLLASFPPLPPSPSVVDHLDQALIHLLEGESMSQFEQKVHW